MCFFKCTERPGRENCSLPNTSQLNYTSSVNNSHVLSTYLINIRFQFSDIMCFQFVFLVNVEWIAVAVVIKKVFDTLPPFSSRKIAEYVNEELSKFSIHFFCRMWLSTVDVDGREKFHTDILLPWKRSFPIVSIL